MAQEDEKNGDESIIPEEDFREAIAACCRDPEMNRYFSLAPRGAKLFIGLAFYCTYFGDKVDPRQYAECLEEIEPALEIADLKYLIRFESNDNTLQYLRELLAIRKGEAVVVPVEQEEPVEAEESAEPEVIVEAEKPAEPEKPVEPEKPAEPEKPDEPEKPIETERFAEPEKVVVVFEKSIEIKNPAEPPKTVEKTAEAEKPAEPPKVAEEPVVAEKPAEPPKVAEEPVAAEKPAEPPKVAAELVAAEKPAEPPKVAAEPVKPIEVKEPVEPPKAVEKPVAAEKPIEPPKVAVEPVKSTEVKKPVEAKKKAKEKAKAEKAASGRRGIVPKRMPGGGVIVVEGDEVGGPIFPFIAVSVVAALFLVVVGGIWWLYSTWRAKPPAEVKIVENVEVERAEHVGPTNLTNRMAEKRARKKPETVKVMEHMSEVDPDETDARQHAATPVIAEQAAVPETPRVAAAALPAAKGKRKRRVVFTDGRKIVRHSNGLVEVPRVFSCAGAGVKPFWIYSANPEADAAKERKAREEWESLCREVE